MKKQVCSFNNYVQLSRIFCPFSMLRPKGKADAGEQRATVTLSGTSATTRWTEKSHEVFDQGETDFCLDYKQKASFYFLCIVQILLESKRIQKYNSVYLFMILSKMSCLVRMHLVIVNVFLWIFVHIW